MSANSLTPEDTPRLNTILDDITKGHLSSLPTEFKAAHIAIQYAQLEREAAMLKAELIGVYKAVIRLDDHSSLNRFTEREQFTPIALKRLKALEEAK
jgi:hypothetical protein